MWLLDDNPRLGPQARKNITSAQGVYVSAAMVWELTIKAMFGKLTVPADLSKRLTEQGLELLSITAEHAEAIRDFPELTRHDPFDRLIVAQASRRTSTPHCRSCPAGPAPRLHPGRVTLAATAPVNPWGSPSGGSSC